MPPITLGLALSSLWPVTVAKHSKELPKGLAALCSLILQHAVDLKV